MTGLFFALFAPLIAGIGGRDQLLVAQLSQRQGARPTVLLVALASGIAASAAAAWGGAQVAWLLTGPARLLLAAIAVGLAGFELIILSPRRRMREPTNSLGALAIVIFAIQLTDAARFMIFALAALTRAPLTAGMGGAIAAMAIVSAGWVAFDTLQSPRLTELRRWLGAGLLLLALGLGARAMGYL